MTNRAKRISLISAGVFAFALCLPAVTRAQEDPKPLPERPQPESPKNDPAPAPEPPRSDPAPAPEPPRSDPAPAPEPPKNDPAPAPAPPPEPPRNDPPATPPSGGGGSGSNNNDNGRRNVDNDNRRNSDNDNRRNNDTAGSRNRDSGSGRSGNENPPAINPGSGSRVRGTMTGDGSGNRRERTIETGDGQIVPVGSGGLPTSTSAGTSGTGAVGGGNPGGNPGNRGGGSPGGGNPGNRGGGNPGGGGNDRHRDRGRDRDHDGRHEDRNHRHYRGDECYQVPTYDDTVSYSANNYPVYDPDDSLSAYDRGYNDGLYTGANDGRRGQTFDPERSHFYKSSDHGYRSIKGPRDIYQQAYRDGFLRGYREGFQNWQQYFVNGSFIRK